MTALNIYIVCNLKKKSIKKSCCQNCRSFAKNLIHDCPENPTVASSSAPLRNGEICCWQQKSPAEKKRCKNPGWLGEWRDAKQGKFPQLLPSPLVTLGDIFCSARPEGNK
jgi:hypothetical protein